MDEKLRFRNIKEEHEREGGKMKEWKFHNDTIIFQVN